MSNVKAKVSVSRKQYWVDVILANVDAQPNDYKKSRKAYSECNFADYELGLINQRIADQVSTLSDDNASDMEKMRAERAMERFAPEKDDLQAQLEAAMEVQQVFSSSSQYYYKAKNLTK